MKTALHLLFYSFIFLVIGCSFEDLPDRKNRRACQQPTASIATTVDASDYRAYTISLTNSSGDIETVEWQIGTSSETHKPTEAFKVNFAQPGTYTIKATLKNSCNLNTTVETSVVVSASNPTVATVSTDSIGTTMANVSINITKVGNGAITEYGVYYSEDPNVNPGPDTGIEKVTGNPALNTRLTIRLKNLKVGKKYHYRAYARNSVNGEGRGDVLSLTTRNIAAVTTWIKTIGGSGTEVGYYVLPNATGYLIAGNTGSSNGDMKNASKGSYDGWVAQLDFSGTIIWQETYGGSGDDVFRYVQQTPDGNYLLMGNTSSTTGDVGSNKGDYDAWVVKINPSGGIIWKNSFGTANRDFAYSGVVTPSGDLLLVGETLTSGVPRAWVRKISSSGNELLAYNWTNSPSSVWKHIFSPTPGSYLLSGAQTVSVNKFNLWTAKFDSDNNWANPTWQSTPGGIYDDVGYWSVASTDGGIFTAGINTAGVDELGTWAPNLFAVKHKPSGSEDWQKIYGGTREEFVYSVANSTDGGYTIVGYTQSVNGDISNNKGGNDLWLIKLDASGQKTSLNRTIGGSGNETGHCIQPTPDGGYIIVGFTTSSDGDIRTNRGGEDILIIKTDSEGNFRQ
ncbi:hypothetical protein [Tellurirhabdus bombi]|uniref:hypothetical protein n=1 Tax=Tellurirhabdus bombi TaxID=2907205 RepID=UPI001F1E7AA1|nr:hypothetical protein [Tellurirhabdus bombi]